MIFGIWRVLLRSTHCWHFFFWEISVIFTICTHFQSPLGCNSLSLCEEKNSLLWETHLLLIANHPAQGLLVSLQFIWGSCLEGTKVCLSSVSTHYTPLFPEESQTLPSALLFRVLIFVLVTKTAYLDRVAMLYTLETHLARCLKTMLPFYSCWHSQIDKLKSLRSCLPATIVLQIALWRSYKMIYPERKSH